MEVVLALIATGVIPLIAKAWFDKPKTLADARKSEYEAAIVLLEGWEKMVASLKDEMEKMETRYESKLQIMEQKMEAKEKWYLEQITLKDTEIKKLREDVSRLERKLSRYEGIKDKIDVAKGELHLQVEERLENAKQGNNEEKAG